MNLQDHIATWAGPQLRYSVDLPLLIPLQYGKLATKYPWIYGYVYSVGLVYEAFRIPPLMSKRTIGIPSELGWRRMGDHRHRAGLASASLQPRSS